jgi:hypothetical protein
MEVKATSTGKLLDSLPRNDMVAESELCYGKFNVAYYRVNYQHHHLVVLRTG